MYRSSGEFEPCLYIKRAATFSYIRSNQQAIKCYGPTIPGYHSHCRGISLNIHFHRINQFDSFHQTLDARTNLFSFVHLSNRLPLHLPKQNMTKHTCGTANACVCVCVCGHLNMIKCCRFAQVICVTFFLATHRHESHYIFTKAQRQSVSFYFCVFFFTVWFKCA